MLPLTREALLAAPGPFVVRPFYGHQPRADGQLADSCFSQWWPCRFEEAGITYSSAEQFMMAGKARLFGDADALGQILSEPSPAKAKAIGRRVQKFDSAVWERHRFDLVTVGNVAKFGGDAALREYLLATADELLVEASPRDRIWGVGLARDNPLVHQPSRWRGRNLLGFALVRARAILRGEVALPSVAGADGLRP
jgi:hypothetical protein